MTSEGEEREKGFENLFDEIMGENFLNLRRNRYSGIGSTESPKQDEPKEAHAKADHN